MNAHDLIEVHHHDHNKEVENLMINQEIELLKSLPTESNYITRKWSAIGIVQKNAFDSQAHLEIYKQFCMRKRCLNCSIGIKLLNK